VIVPGAVSLVLYGLPRSIDFVGGALYEVSFADAGKVTEQALRAAYDEVGIGDLQVVEAGDSKSATATYQLRSKHIGADEREALAAAFRTRFGDFTELRFESVGPSVGASVSRNAAVAVAMAALGILLYLWFAFRAVPHPLRYGICAVIAMLHDVLVITGLASIAGKVLGMEADALFLTALLTIIGFSVHDTIVVFDRIRENVGRLRGLSFERIVGHSVVQTLDRSINTQLTAIFTLVAVFVFSQGQLRQFVGWLIIGIISGTYSSIFNAAQLLVVWEGREWRNWFRRRRTGEAATA